MGAAPAARCARRAAARQRRRLRAVGARRRARPWLLCARPHLPARAPHTRAQLKCWLVPGEEEGRRKQLEEEKKTAAPPIMSHASSQASLAAHSEVAGPPPPGGAPSLARRSGAGRYALAEGFGSAAGGGGGRRHSQRRCGQCAERPAPERRPGRQRPRHVQAPVGGLHACCGRGAGEGGWVGLVAAGLERVQEGGLRCPLAHCPAVLRPQAPEESQGETGAVADAGDAHAASNGGAGSRAGSRPTTPTAAAAAAGEAAAFAQAAPAQRVDSLDVGAVQASWEAQAGVCGCGCGRAGPAVQRAVRSSGGVPTPAARWRRQPCCAGVALGAAGRRRISRPTAPALPRRASPRLYLYRLQYEAEQYRGLLQDAQGGTTMEVRLRAAPCAVVRLHCYPCSGVRLRPCCPPVCNPAAARLSLSTAACRACPYTRSP